MRRDDQQQSGMFTSYVSLEEQIPQAHSLRVARRRVDEARRTMAKDFDGLTSRAAGGIRIALGMNYASRRRNGCERLLYSPH